MRVIKRAKSYKVTCPKCLSILEFGLENIQVKDAYTSSEVGTVLCPVCRESIIVRRHNCASDSMRMTDNVTAYFEPEEGCCANVVEEN